jgi:hypothetical protein
MGSAEHVSRKKAIRAAEEAMRSSFGANVRFEPVLLSSPFQRMFRVLDSRGQQLQVSVYSRSESDFKNGLGRKQLRRRKLKLRWGHIARADYQPSSRADAGKKLPVRPPIPFDC